MTPLRVFIGYDSRQPVAFQVAAHSVWAHASCAVAITRLDLAILPLKARGLTEFTYTRYCVPYLCDYDGPAIFFDSDVLVRGDVAELLAYPMMEALTPVFVVPHAKKFERPSVMVFNTARCRHLTPAYLQDHYTALPTLTWAEPLGALPKDWNHLVNYDPPNPNAKLAHFTQGLPVWDETKDCEFAGEWWSAYKDSARTCSFKELMGRSVHVPHMKKVGV